MRDDPLWLIIISFAIARSPRGTTGRWMCAAYMADARATIYGSLSGESQVATCGGPHKTKPTETHRCLRRVEERNF
jgi:hypothetical protein